MQESTSIPIDHKEQFREMIHNEVDKWVDELLVLFEEDSQPTLTDISEVFTETRQKFRIINNTARSKPPLNLINKLFVVAGFAPGCYQFDIL